MIYTLTLNPSVDKTIYIDSNDQKTFYSAGGKGINVSKTLKEIGEESVVLGFIGGENGRFIKKKLDELNIKNDLVEISGNNRLNTKLIDGDKLTELNEKGPLVSENDITELINKIRNKIKENDVIAISGSACLGVDEAIYRKIIDIANNNGAKTILDADNALFKLGIKAKPYAVKPNVVELCKYFGIEETNNIDLLKIHCLKLIEMGIHEVLLSMGENGALYVENNTCLHVDALDIEVKSTVGAGDAMVAALALSIKNSLNVEEKIKMAIASASGACLSEGTEPSNIDIINELKSKVIIKSC